MQQRSSVPERKLEIDATSEKMLTTNPGAVPVGQLHGELWLERCLNQIQQRINDCLVCVTTQKTAQESVAEILQTVVQELNIALGSGVAIALADTPASDILCCVSKPAFRICYVDPVQSQISNTKDDLRTEPTKEPVVILETGNIALKLGEVIALEDLQHLQNQKLQSAWSLEDDQGVVYWLIAANPDYPITSPLPSDLESVALKTQIQRQLMERSLTAALLAVTQLRRLQAALLQCQQLEARNRELVQTNQLKSEFLANTSHEIRTPLSSILGFTHLLQAQGYSPDNLRHQEYLNIILSSGQHLLAVINDILDLSKIEANQLEVQWESINVPALCRSVITLVREKASDKGLELRLDLDAHATTMVADSLRLKQMLFNLLSNALKFTSFGKVGLQVKHQNKYLHFTVWDTGIGISKEEQTQLFQPYSQIANVVAGRQEGTGLGLALTQKLAELHGGWVEVQSELNRGSRFTVVLPSKLTSRAREVGEAHTEVLKDSLAESNSALPTPCTPHIATAPILLVEDNIHNAKLMTTYLKKLGYQVIWVQNAAEMWQALVGRQPALILMDVHLPDVDGLTLVQQLQAHEQYRTIPVIAQTAMAMKGDRETCLAAGAIDYISKPIDLKSLAQLVSKYSDVTAI